METKQVPAVDWFSWPSAQPQLIGSHCRSCDHTFFPKLTVCRNPNCRSRDVDEILLSRSGKLWSYVIQQYAPPPPFPQSTAFVPYAIAEVKLPEGIKVLGQMTAATDLQSLHIGMTVEVVVEKFYDDQEGNEVVIWKFQPRNDETSGVISNSVEVLK